MCHHHANGSVTQIISALVTCVYHTASNPVVDVHPSRLALFGERAMSILMGLVCLAHHVLKCMNIQKEQILMKNQKTQCAEIELNL